MAFNIAKCRKNAGLTQQQAADLMNVKKRTFASWEREETMINLEQACRLCEILGCTIDQLSGFEDIAAPAKKVEYSIEKLHSLDESELDEVQTFVDFIVSRRDQ